MAKQLDPKSVQFEESEPKSQRSWESEEARRARQAKLARDLEWEAIRRRRAILRAAIGIPLCLIVATAAILLGLDKSGTIHLGVFKHDTAPPPSSVVAAPAPAPTPPPLLVVKPLAEANTVLTPDADPAPPTAEPATSEEAAPAIDDAQLAKLKDRVARFEGGSASIGKDLIARQADVTREDQALYGTYNPTPQNRLNDGLVQKLVQARKLQAQYAASASRGNASDIQAARAFATAADNLDTSCRNEALVHLYPRQHQTSRPKASASTRSARAAKRWRRRSRSRSPTWSSTTPRRKDLERPGIARDPRRHRARRERRRHRLQARPPHA
jgi:hypothetical protein